MKFDMGAVVKLKDREGEWLIVYRMFDEYTIVPYDREKVMESEIERETKPTFVDK